MSSDSKARGGCSGNQAPPLQAELQTSSEMQAGVSHVSEFDVPQMDCPSEENLIRTAFASLGEAVTLSPRVSWWR